MHITQVVLDLSKHSTGVLDAVHAFQTAIEELGHDVEQISFDREPHPATDRPQRTVGVPAVNLPGLKRYGYAPASARHCAEKTISGSDCVLIHAVYGHHSAWALTMARRYGKPVVIIPHGSLTDFCLSNRGPAKRIWLRVMGEDLRRATFLFSSEYEREQALRYVRPAYSETVGWPLWPPMSPAPPVRPAEVRQLERRAMLLVGRLHPMKRTVETVQSFARGLRPGWTLYLAGPPTPEISVLDVRAAAGDAWDKSVRYVGMLSQPEVDWLYTNADALVLFSKGDNFSFVAARALTFGLPVYTSPDVGVASEILRYGFGDVFKITGGASLDTALTSAMDRAVRTDDQRRAAISRTATGLFSFDRFKHGVEKLLRFDHPGVPPNAATGVGGSPARASEAIPKNPT